MRNLLLAFNFLFCAMSFADEKSLIELSLTLNKNGDSHLIQGSRVVSTYTKNGTFSKKPDSYDYNDYYTLKKDFNFLASQLIVYEYEHIEKYLGCCVNPGSAVILIPQGEITEIVRFAKKNKCRVNKGDQIFYVPPEALYKTSVPKTSLVELSCKQDYIGDESYRLAHPSGGAR